MHKDDAGNITFIFTKDATNSDDLIAKTLYYRSNLWGDEVTISDHEGYVSAPKTVMDNQGNIIAAWGEVVEGKREIWAAKYVASGLTWGAPVRMSSRDNHTYPMALKLDGVGNAYLLARIQKPNSVYQAEVFYFNNEESTWGEGIVFGSEADFTIINSLTVSLDGSATLVGYREHLDGAYITSLYTYDPKTKAWGDELVMDDLISEWHSPITSAADGKGNVLLIATAKKPREESFSTWYRVYNQQTGMLSLWQLMISDLPNAGIPIVGMSEAGDAFFMWQYALPGEMEGYFPSHIRYAQFK